jgi:hypothetical protein
VHYYNPITKNIMATIDNNSNFDFGCTKVELLRTGTGASQAWGSLVGDKVSDKVFKITTTNTSTSAPYNVKLYYTDAEINGWFTITGNTLSDLRMVKANGDLTQISPTLPAIFSSINSKNNFGATPHSIVGATFTGTSGISNYALMKPYGIADCSNSIINYATDIIGTAYQWQVNNGSGYNNITNNATYNNANTSSININNPPANILGNKYRCAVTSAFGTLYSREFILKFGNTWLGIISKAWENPLNWSCNTVPNDKTDVIINSGTTFVPEVNANTTVRSIILNNGAQLTVQPTVNITVNH